MAYRVHAWSHRIYIKGFLSELENVKTVKLDGDNQGVQKLARNSIYHSQTKHIDIKFHFIREAIEKHEVDIEYIPTEEMPADLMTKPLCKARHENHVAYIILELIYVSRKAIFEETIVYHDDIVLLFCVHCCFFQKEIKLFQFTCYIKSIVFFLLIFNNSSTLNYKTQH